MAALESIEYREQSPPGDQFLRLFASVGWTSSLPPDRLIASLDGSWHAVSAYVGDRLVGLGRTISDGHLHALIVEVIVDPEWQLRGIGREIMTRLLARCRAAGIDSIQLFSARGKRGFYEGLGFEARPQDSPGMEIPPG